MIDPVRISWIRRHRTPSPHSYEQACRELERCGAPATTREAWRLWEKGDCQPDREREVALAVMAGRQVGWLHVRIKLKGKEKGR